MSLGLTACGDDYQTTADQAQAELPGDSGSGSGSGSNNDQDAPVTALSISGSPASGVNPGDEYRFEPRVDGSDNATLTFSIINKPGWAEFDPSTGILSGSPDEAHIGTTLPIRIDVTDGYRSALGQPFTITVEPYFTGRIVLNWIPPYSNEDGSPLWDLRGYRIYYGLEPGNYTEMVEINDPNATSVVIDDLPPDTYYIVSTAFDAEGLESDHSNVITRRVM